MAAALLASIPQPHSVHRIGGPVQDDALMSVWEREALRSGGDSTVAAHARLHTKTHTKKIPPRSQKCQFHVRRRNRTPGHQAHYHVQQHPPGAACKHRCSLPNCQGCGSHFACFHTEMSRQEGNLQRSAAIALLACGGAVTGITEGAATRRAMDGHPEPWLS